MGNINLKGLAKRAVAAKGWRWMPGMHTDGMLVVDVDDDGMDVVRKGTVQELSFEYAFPDLDNPATRGCLRTLVREAWSEDIVITVGPGWWSIKAGNQHRGISDREWDGALTESLLHGLVAALEAAP